MANPKFPVTVKRGSAVVKIYFTPSKGCDSFTVAYWNDGKRVRKVYSSFQTAKLEAELAANQLTTGDLDVLTLKSEDRAAYLRALHHLDPIGIPIETAAAEYSEARKQLGDVPLSRAVEHYLRHHPPNIAPRPVDRVIDELLEAKKHDGRSEVYLDNLRYNFRKFANGFQCNIADITGLDIDRWMRNLKLSPRTRNNLRASLKTLFNFAKARKYLPKDFDELAAVGTAKKSGGEIEIFKPEEMKTILQCAPSKLIPFLTLGAFAGIRHAEIQRLDWKDIRFKDGIIDIRAAKAKTASRRTIPLLPNLRAWLRTFRKTSGPVFEGQKPGNALILLTETIQKSTQPGSKRSKFAWKHNGLRHSFISYRISQTQNVAQVALEADNSPQVIFSNYRELVTPSAAKAWFEISPES